MTSRPVLWAIAVAQAALSIGLAVFIGSGIIDVFCDDAYYYGLIAWNTAHGIGPSFDGIHATNGVQMLWYVILTGIAYLLPAKSSMPLAIAVTQAACVALSYIPLSAVARRIGHGALWPMIGAWAFVSFASPYLSLGMEAALLGLLVWWFVAEAMDVSADDERTPYLLPILAVALVWARIDAALFVIPALAVLVIPRGVRACIEIGVITAFGISSLAAAYYAMGGTIIPISALIKASGDNPLLASYGVRDMLVWAMPHILPVSLWWMSFIVFMIAAGIAIATPRFRHIAAALLSGWLVWFVAVAIDHPGYEVWPARYRVPLHIVWIVLVGIAVSRMDRRIIRASTAAGLVAVIAAYGAWGLRVMAQVSPSHVSRIARIAGTPAPLRNSDTILGAARWIQGTPPGTICAAWNAGAVGFYSDRPVINLDGFVNDEAYYRDVLRGPVPLVEYLRTEHVAYVVDYYHSADVIAASSYVARISRLVNPITIRRMTSTEAIDEP